MDGGRHKAGHRAKFPAGGVQVLDGDKALSIVIPGL